MTTSANYSPAAAASATGQSITTIRNYCRDLSPILSAGANPGQGIERRLTGQDVAIIQRAADLRKQGYTVADIVSTIRSEGIEAIEPYIDVEPASAINPHQIEGETGVKALQAPENGFSVVYDLSIRFDALQARIESQQRESAGRLTILALGILIGIGIAVLIILSVWVLSGTG